MDNRRVVKSYRERIKNSALPYGSKNSFFSKVRSFFNSSRNETEDVSVRKEGETSEEQAKNDKTDDFSIQVPATPLRQPVGDSVNSPNNILSEFFKEKGNTPLTEVEYEGVVSLLAKNTQGNSNLSSAIKKRSSINQLSERPSKIAKKSDTPDAETSSISNYETPFQQRTLRNKPVNEKTLEFSTPEYKPVYHSVNEQLNSRSVPSVKRVYQFSGIPSPYSTHIKTPRTLSSQDFQNSIPEQTTSISDSKPISNTASTLLSILDGKEVEDGDSSTAKHGLDVKGKKFSNPYAGPRMKLGKKLISVAESSDVSGTSLTANDISKTISFSNSQELPKTVESQDKVGKTSYLGSSDKKPLPKPTGSVFKFSSELSAKKEIPTTEKPLAEKEASFLKEPSATKFNFSSTQPSAFSVSKSSEPASVSKPTNSFNFEKKVEVANSSKPSLTQFPKSETTKNKDLSNQFTFPSVVNAPIKIDRVKVDAYKSLFNF